MKKFWVFLAFLLTTTAISACTHNFTEEFLYDYPIKDFKKAKGIVFDINTEKGLYTPPVYLAKVELKADQPTDNIYPQEIRISKRQVMEARNGKAINGYTADGTDFHTFQDVLYNSSMYLLFISIGILLLCITLLLWMTQYKVFRPFLRLLGKLPIFQKDDLIQRVILLGLIIPILIYSLFFFANLGQKFIPFNKDILVAEVISKDYDYNSNHDSYHRLEIGYEISKDEYTVVDKEVSARTYSKYEPGDSIKIAVPKKNPYNVFIANLSFLEVISSFFKLRILLIFLFLPLFIGFYRLMY
ncbi:hypothetical protein [Lederbergia ruris]|uniref:DUF3592 domain-containing protein n=1 Tax=Lederbergia ruris TaxID=217495 RepID=A0ABQ4KNH9_9BACI|nr:hypothetical protein [Lederbergia ruris]GIN59054.1 hypothetical protein J8TS2_33730 [Lederbergia ruris]